MNNHLNKEWQVHPYLHELFGKKIVLLELYVTLLFSVGSTILLLLFTDFEWSSFAIWKVILLVILFIDITGGVVANFSFSTNLYYLKSPRARLVFIALHIQPLIFSWILNDYYFLCLAIWGFTIAVALTINALSKHSSHRLLAGALTMLGVVILFLLSEGLQAPMWLTLLLLFYIVKVGFSFAVNHSLNNM